MEYLKQVEEDSSASPARKIHRSRTISCTELTEDQLRHVVAKILQVSWSEDSAGKSIYIKLSLNFLCDNGEDK